LRQAGKLAQQQGQNAGGHGVKRAEVADGAFAGNSSQDSDYIVASHAGRFVYNEKPVHFFTLRHYQGSCVLPNSVLSCRSLLVAST
jgi:hypothetical protein